MSARPQTDTPPAGALLAMAHGEIGDAMQALGAAVSALAMLQQRLGAAPTPKPSAAQDTDEPVTLGTRPRA